ncbi:MAG: prepilin-type N-terminal cleavage/methylation domain-containing protein, partial [Elusimicrobia bacterium]
MKKTRISLFPNKARGVSRGLSLVEMLVALSLLSIGALSFFGVFGGIARGVQNAKARSLAANLCQEQVQILKQKNYYRVMVTTAPSFDLRFSTPIPYDTSYFPPETVLEGGITFTRLTNLDIAQEVSGNIATLAPTSSDTGIKLLTVTTIWTQGREARKVETRNVLSNPDAVMTTSILRGKVTNASTAAALPDASVVVTENTGFVDTTNATGDYVINLFAGNYNLFVTAPGFFPKAVPVAVPANSAVTQNITLSPMATRTLTGWAWVTDHLVISQIMGQVPTSLPSGIKGEYVEIFNPTTFTWTVSGNIGLKFRPLSWIGPERDIDIDYTGSPATIAPGGYYLFANTGPIVVNGTNVIPDAVWNATVGGANDVNFPYFDTTPGSEDFNIIPINTDGAQEGAGHIRLMNTGTGATLDTLGWEGGGGGFAPANFESIPIDQFTGLQDNEQFTRLSSTAGASATLGRAYDMNYNVYDFWTTAHAGGTMYTPRTTASSTQTVLSGTPPIGGTVSCTDGLSAPDAVEWEFYTNGVTDAWAGRYYLLNVATGTWSVYLGYGTRFQQIDNVVVPVGAGDIPIPDASTVPPWQNAGYSHVFLTTTTTDGWVLGRVLNVSGTGIAPGIQVTNNLNTVTASSLSPYRYFLRTIPGVYDMTANPNNANASYVSAVQPGVTVNAGQITSGVDFVLSQGGGLNGFVSRDGTNPLPGIAVTATNGLGLVEATAVSGADGRFRMSNMSTGTYLVEAQTASGESATPASVSTAVVVGVTRFVSTFTVSGASGFITGGVTVGGNVLQTGVLVVASTATIVNPPSLSTTTLLGAGYYVGSSLESGNYFLEVRGSTNPRYNIYAF